MSLRRFSFAGMLLYAVVAASLPAWAVIERPLPLKTLVGDSDFVVSGLVKELDASRPSMVIAVQGDIKGKAPMRRLAVLLKGEDGKGGEQLSPRLSVGSAVVGFITINDDDNPNTPDPLIALLYFEGTWVQLNGTPAGDNYRWQFTHVEPYLRRTFAGRSKELAELVANALVDKATWPEVQTGLKPGLGPTIGEPGNPIPTAEHANESEHGGDLESPATDPWRTAIIAALGFGGLIIAGVIGIFIWKTQQKPASPNEQSPQK